MPGPVPRPQIGTLSLAGTVSSSIPLGTQTVTVMSNDSANSSRSTTIDIQGPTPTPTPTQGPLLCQGPKFGEDQPSTGVLRLIYPLNDEGYSCGYGWPSMPDFAQKDDSASLVWQTDFYTSHAEDQGLAEYSIIDRSRYPADGSPELACEHEWEYVPRGIYVPC
jgi:hypothetical protein